MKKCQKQTLWFRLTKAHDLAPKLFAGKTNVSAMMLDPSFHIISVVPNVRSIIGRQLIQINFRSRSDRWTIELSIPANKFPHVFENCFAFHITKLKATRSKSFFFTCIVMCFIT